MRRSFIVELTSQASTEAQSTERQWWVQLHCLMEKPNWDQVKQLLTDLPGPLVSFEVNGNGAKASMVLITHPSESPRDIVDALRVKLPGVTVLTYWLELDQDRFDLVL